MLLGVLFVSTCFNINNLQNIQNIMNVSHSEVYALIG